MDFYDYFQIVALVAFVSILAARSLVMLVREGTNPFSLGRGKLGVRRLAEVVMGPALAVWMVALVVSAVDDPAALPAPFDEEIINAEWARAAGAVLLAASVSLFLWALASFGTSWRIGIDERSPGALMTAGVFAYSRNPIFVSMDAFLLGVFLIQGALFFLLAAILCACLTHFQILQEEAFLTREYGGGYVRYRSVVPRYFGFGRGAAQRQAGER